MDKHLLYCAVVAAMAIPAISIGGGDKLRQDLGGMKLQVQTNVSANDGGVGTPTTSPAIDGVSVTNNDRVAARCALLGPKERMAVDGGQVIEPGQSSTVRMESGTVDTTAATSLKCEPKR